MSAVAPGPGLVPAPLLRAGARWEERQADLAGAARLLGGADPAGFTPTVAGAATRFADTWRRHVGDLAEESRAVADGLRAAPAELVAADEGVAVDQQALGLRLRGPW